MNVRVLVVTKCGMRGEPVQVTEGMFTMVAIDKDGKPIKVPPL